MRRARAIRLGDMSDVRVEIIKLPRGKYGLQVVGDDGPPVLAPRSANSLKRTAAERREGRRAIQAALKAEYERQQAQAS